MKRMVVFVIFFICILRCQAQTVVMELSYGINFIQHSALCVFNGNEGKCKVLSTAGDCWFDAYYFQNNSAIKISLSNPTVNGWIPVEFYITQYGNYVICQGNQYGLGVNLVQERDWNTKKAQYGFRLDNTPFRDDEWMIVEISVNRCSGEGSYCSCKKFIGLKRRGRDSYKGKCKNWLGHYCNHGPKAHGLPEY